MFRRPLHRATEHFPVNVLDSFDSVNKKGEAETSRASASVICFYFLCTVKIDFLRVEILKRKYQVLAPFLRESGNHPRCHWPRLPPYYAIISYAEF